MDQLINSVFCDRYQVQSLLGRKSGRRTFLAKDLTSQSIVVLKLLLFAPDFTWEDLKLFEREAETLKLIDHPAIPKYLDSFEADTELGKGFALVQSYIEARSLQEWVQSGRSFTELELREIAQQLLKILAFLHDRNPPVIHRDIKPSNILLGDRSGNSPGQVYLVDFGSVQTAAHGGTVTVVGTYGYMPPEQFGGRSLPASDLFSLGATLIYLTTGQHPADLPQADLRIEFEKSASLSKSFTQWIRGLTEPSLSKRIASVEEAIDRMQRPQSLPSDDRFLSRRSAFKTQLQATSKLLYLEVSREQLRSPVMFSFSPEIRVVSTIFILLVLGIPSGFNIAILLSVFIVWLLFIPAFTSGVPIPFFSPRRYKIEFNKVENFTYAFLAPKNSAIILMPPQKLLRISADLHSEPDCVLGFEFQTDEGRPDGFQLIGNHDEIQWLCDELAAWGNLKIQYRSPPSR